MSDIVHILSKVQSGIEGGVYRTIRLVDVTKKKPIIPWNKSNDEDMFRKLSFIKNKISNLNPGQYAIECASSFRSNYPDIFDFSITGKTDMEKIKVTHEEVQEAQIMKDSLLSMEEFKSQVMEMATMKTELMLAKQEITFLREQLEDYKEMLRNAPEPLEDEKPSFWAQFGEMLSENLPDIVDGLKNRRTQNSQSQMSQPEENVQLEQIVNEIKSLMEAGHDDEVEHALDILKKENRLLFRAVCDKLGIQEKTANNG